MNAQEAKLKLHVARTLLGTGMLRPERLDKTLRSVLALRRWGPTSAAAYNGAAIRYPDRAAVIDDRGTVTFRDIHERTQCAGTRAARGRHLRTRRRRDHVPQPPRLHRGHGRLLEARSRRALSEHRLCRPADHRRDRARRPRRGYLRRGVLGAGRQGRREAQTLCRHQRSRRGALRADARATDRRRERARSCRRRPRRGAS